MAQWDLAEIRGKVRNLTGRVSASNLSNDTIDLYINRYAQYEFPLRVKLEKQKTRYSFNTVKDQQDYTFSANYTDFSPQVWIDRLRGTFYQDPDSFRLANEDQVSRLTPWTGDGATTAFSDTLTSYVPILPGSMIVEDTVETFTDDGAGVLTGSAGGSGTVDYTTGAVSLTFNTAPTDGQTIELSFIAYTANKPYSVLMFDSMFRLFPIPDRVYRIEMQAYSNRIVVDASGNDQGEFTLGTDRPRLDEWGPAFALGASRRIVSDNGEMDLYGELTLLHDEQIDLISARTMRNLMKTRTIPSF